MPEAKYILGLDQSTQGTKALIYDENGKIIARADLLHKQMIDERGWVEHDPQEILANTYKVIADVIDKAQIDKNKIVSLGISNQRETAMAWNKKTGQPVYPAIVWQCARGENICKKIADNGYSKKIKDATGLFLSPYFSAAKLAWILENVPSARAAANNNELCCGTMDSWLVYSLTKGKEFKTDYSNASRTQLFNINTLSWDKVICDVFGLPINSLPEVVDSNAFYGMTDLNGFLAAEIPIHAVMGDSHAALFGQGCHKPGGVKATYGTGSSVMINTGNKLIRSKNGLVTSLAWSIDGKVNYVLEGNINYTGAVISWLKDDLQLIDSAGETEQLAKEANIADKTYFVPAFTGLGAPYWKNDAAGMITGMTRTTGKKEIVKAALDSISYQITDILKLMQSESGMDIKTLRVDGGPTKNKYLMQFQADIQGFPVLVPEVEELSASGAAYLAGISLGLYDINDMNFSGRHKKYEVLLMSQEREKLYTGWKNAIERTIYNL
ncbi:glycerol kinase GlpK [Pectinatus brassicae]|uniref:ATP:glycerol 3-phosphotransferase n=1 Tax=Pectinatus brassicae TaxID=862415 RepID=A0A840UYD4_9FIRM|nr:glycerol kinase GlpK [Pectinatus brassicae]MBB5337385.1 glycerol kinase [Pectinatus brassicae]